MLSVSTPLKLVEKHRPSPLAEKISVALIEDNRLVREGITALFSQLSDIEIVAGRSSDDLGPMKAMRPQVVLLDIGFRKGESLRVAAKVRSEFPDAKIVVMDRVSVQEDIAEFVNVGVSGFVVKDATVDDLASTIRSVANGVSVLPPPMLNALFSQMARETGGRGGAYAAESVRLTPREHQVISLIAEGLSNKEIAGRLDIATHTVKSHVRNVMDKLALRTRLQIAAYAHGELVM